MRRPQNLKKSPTCFDRIAVFTQQRQNKWEIFFKFLWTFQKNWTLYIVCFPKSFKLGH